MFPTNEISLDAADNSAATVLQRETRTAHCEAESNGFMHALLSPELELGGYVAERLLAQLQECSM